MSKKNPYKAAAILAGEKTFFDNNPCPAGHIHGRYTKNSECIECARIGSSIRIKSRTPEKAKESAKRFRQENSEKISKKHKIYRDGNKEKLKAQQGAWRSANPDKVKATQKKWADANPEKLVARSARRRSRKANAVGSHNGDDIKDLLEKQKNKCANCTKNLKQSGTHRYHVDHVMPLALGGSNCRTNLQILCPECNRKKHAKHPMDWAKENGRLF